MSTTQLLEPRPKADSRNARAPHGRRRAAATAPRAGGLAAQAASAVGRIFIALLLISAAAIFLFLAVGPRFLNYQTSTMLTGSMSPGINPGDVVVSSKIPVSDLAVGDIITYSIPIDDHRIETHRVTGISTDKAGLTSVTTKGDANPGADPWAAVLSENHVYRNVAVVPYLGDGIRVLRQPPVQTVLLYGAPAVVVLLVLKSIWAKPKLPSGDSGGSDVLEPEIQQ
ncbi:signal peptidase I [Arthrobacter oryzae]|uniref:signal peptidase I n=1 Tax=Arthrobacter oryzae TaxID=409290 RepID=UPI002181E799|nr:signal peptidase I [Arthrobacter oryzae]